MGFIRGRPGMDCRDSRWYGPFENLNVTVHSLRISQGAAIGLNSAFLNIVTEWLSDIKLGYCTTAFYLNESFCCWGEESGTFSFVQDAAFRTLTVRIGCAEFKRWTSVGVVNYLVYILFAVWPISSRTTGSNCYAKQG